MKARQLILTAGAVAALSAPASQAMPLSDEGGGSTVAYVPFRSDFGPAAVASPAPSEQAVRAMGLRYRAMAQAYDSRGLSRSAIDRIRHQESLLRLDEIASNQGATSVRPDDRAGSHGVGGGQVQATPTATGSGFDWTWVAAGSSSALGLILAGGALLVASRRHSTTVLTS